MLNLAGAQFDYGNVVFAVLQECEHRRASFAPEAVEEGVRDVAREKLREIRQSYVESGGTPSYWEGLEREVFDAIVPRYVPEAIEITRLERNRYDLWRGGDVAARLLTALIGLTIGVIIIEVPAIPIFWKPFTLITAAVGIFYPEVKKLYFDWRHARLLNRLVVAADRYQKNQRLHFVTNAQVDEALRSMGALEEGESAIPLLKRQDQRELTSPEDNETPHPPQRGSRR